MKKLIAIFVFPLLMACSILDADLPSDKDENNKFLLSATWTSQNRTSISDEFGNVVWNPNDSIALFSSDEEFPIRMITRDGGATALFESDIVPGAAPLIGLYPFDDESYCISNTVCTAIPSVQAPIDNNVDPLAFVSIGKAEDKNIAFHNVCGGIRFTVRSGNIRRVVFSGNDDETLAGDIAIEISDSGISVRGGTSDMVSLTSETDFKPDTYYYLTFIPQTFVDGFTMEFYDAGDALISTSVCPRPVTIRQSVYSTVRNADDPESVSGILTGEDLSVDGTHIANCYIVSSPGYYKIPACTGVSAGYIRDIASVNVVWESANTSQKPLIGEYVSDIAYKGGYIYFKAGEPILESLDNGNALVAARNKSGDILWSWHLWLCDGFDADATAAAAAPSGQLFMDRYLGASGPEKGTGSYGLLYQWGRKDPFMGVSIDNPSGAMAFTSVMDIQASNSVYGKISYITKFPMLFVTGKSDWINVSDNTLWGDVKTDYDPCPYGWKVPSAEAFQGADGQEFPACGFRTGTSGALETSLSEVWCWTSSCDGTKSKALYVNCAGGNVDYGKSTDRANAFAVRCVKDVKE